MDNLTHSLVGALLGQAGLKKKTGLAMPALIIGANLPDVDAACFFWLEGQEHLGFRRGITHGPPALVLLPLILAGLLWGFDRWQQSRGKRPVGRLPVSFRWLFALSFIGCLTHPALDWLNVYGIRLLEPFSSRWFYGDTLFIIDVWLWALMGFATWFSLRREKRGGEWVKPARAALAVALAYIGINGAISQAAVNANTELTEIAGVEAIASPLPVAFWQREVIFHVPGADPEFANPSTSFWSLGSGLGPRNLLPEQKLVLIEQANQQPPSAATIAQADPQVRAFLFWSRVPFTDCSEDGSVLLRDARFYDPLARDRFTVALPDMKCQELPAD